MRIKFETDFTNIKPFMISIMQKLENATLDKQKNSKLENNISTMSCIVFDTSGLFLITKNREDERYIMEVNNLRALECSLYLASETHELDEVIISSGDTKFKERYLTDIKEVLKELGLDHLKMTDTWIVNKKGDMNVKLEFEMDQKRIDLCMYKLDEFIRKEISWEE